MARRSSRRRPVGRALADAWRIAIEVHAGVAGVAGRLAALFGAAQAPASLLAGVSNATQTSPANARRGATLADLLRARWHARRGAARVDDLAVAITRAVIRREDVAVRRVA